MAEPIRDQNAGTSFILLQNFECREVALSCQVEDETQSGKVTRSCNEVELNKARNALVDSAEKLRKLVAETVKYCHSMFYSSEVRSGSVMASCGDLEVGGVNFYISSDDSKTPYGINNIPFKLTVPGFKSIEGQYRCADNTPPPPPPPWEKYFVD